MCWSKFIFCAAMAVIFSFSGVHSASAAKDTIIIDITNEPGNLDPHLQYDADTILVYRNLFDNLLTRDNEGTIIPKVATEWKFVSDTETEFTIRDDIVFHNGQKLTPQDVVYSIKRVTDREFASPQRGNLAAVIDAKVSGPNKVTFYTQSPFPLLLAQVVNLSIVPEAVVEKVGNAAFNLNPVGSGPYKIVAWNRGINVEMTRNDAYWGDKGTFAKAEFRFVNDPATRLADLRTGKADVATDMNYDLAQSLVNDPNVEIRTVLSERIAHLRPNNGRSPTSNPLVRRAIAHAIDKEGLIEGLSGGADYPANVMLTRKHFGWTEAEGYPYDPDKARELVAQAGDEAKQEIILATSPSFDQRIVQAIQQMLADVGLNARIEMMEHVSFLKAVQSGSLETRPHLPYGRWSCSCLDADGVLFPLVGNTNWSMIQRPDLAAELEAARSTLDTEERLAHYKVVNDAIAKDVLLLPLYEFAVMYGVNKRLEWQPIVDENMYINRMRWKE